MAIKLRTNDVVIYEDRWETPFVYYVGVVTDGREADDPLFNVRWHNPKTNTWLEEQIAGEINVIHVGHLPEGTEFDW